MAYVKKYVRRFPKRKNGSRRSGKCSVSDYSRKGGKRHRSKKPSKKIVKSYVGYRYTNNRGEERKIHNKNYRKKLIIQRCAEAIMYHTPALREIVIGYKIVSNVYSIWNDFNTISQKEGKVNFVEDTARAGLSMYQIKMMYDLIDNRVPVNEKLDTKKILENVFLDLTKEEISLVFSSI